MRQEAARLRDAAAQKQASAAHELREADSWDKAADEREASLRAQGLSIDASASKLSEMDAQASDRSRAGRPPGINAGHPIHELPVTVAEIAKSIGVSRTALQDWVGERRKIPRRIAEKLAKQYGIPVDSWPNLRD